MSQGRGENYQSGGAGIICDPPPSLSELKKSYEYVLDNDVPCSLAKNVYVSQFRNIRHDDDVGIQTRVDREKRRSYTNSCREKGDLIEKMWEIYRCI